MIKVLAFSALFLASGTNVLAATEFSNFCKSERNLSNKNAKKKLRSLMKCFAKDLTALNEMPGKKVIAKLC